MPRRATDVDTENKIYVNVHPDCQPHPLNGTLLSSFAHLKFHILSFILDNVREAERENLSLKFKYFWN